MKTVFMILLGAALVLSTAGAVAAVETNELKITTVAVDGYPDWKLTTPAKTITCMIDSAVNGSALSAITLEAVPNPEMSVLYTIASAVNGSDIPIYESGKTLELVPLCTVESAVTGKTMSVE